MGVVKAKLTEENISFVSAKNSARTKILQVLR